MSDSTAKVHKPQGADRLVVESGGAIVIKPGGKIVADDEQAQAIDPITDNTGGSAGDTLAAVSGTGADATINNNFATLAAKLNAIQAALEGVGITAPSS